MTIDKRIVIHKDENSKIIERAAAMLNLEIHAFIKMAAVKEARKHISQEGALGKIRKMIMEE